MPDQNSQVPQLTVVGGAQGHEVGPKPDESRLRARSSQKYDLEWSILMAHAQNGDSVAYRRLLDEITPYLRSLALRRHRDATEAEDAVQDILLTIHSVRQTYDPTRPFGPWLATIANRRIIDRLRRQGRLRSRETVLTAEHETFSNSQSKIEDELSDQRELRAAVDSLPPGQRQAIHLLKLEELSLKEASARTGLSVAALKVATHRAVKNLRTILSSRREDT